MDKLNVDYIPVLDEELRSLYFRYYGNCCIITKCANAGKLQKFLRGRGIQCQMVQWIMKGDISKLILYYSKKTQTVDFKPLPSQYQGSFVYIKIWYSLQLETTNLSEIKRIVAKIEQQLKSFKEFKMKSVSVWKVHQKYYIRGHHLQIIFINDWLSRNQSMQLIFVRPMDCFTGQDWRRLGQHMFDSDYCLKKESVTYLTIHQSKTDFKVYKYKKQDFIRSEQKEKVSRWAGLWE